MYGLMKLHQDGGDALADYVYQWKEKNKKLKEKQKDIENDLSVGPFLKITLVIPNGSNRFKKLVNILSVVKPYIMNNIFEMLWTIEYASQVSFNLGYLNQRTWYFFEFDKSELEGYKEFIEIELLNFCEILGSLFELERDKQGMSKADQMR